VTAKVAAAAANRQSFAQLAFFSKICILITMLAADPAKTTSPHPPTGRAFDTLAFAKRMETVGFTRQQAEALADEQGKLIDERLATKTDVELIRSDLRESELRLETRLVKWVVGIGFAQVAMILAAIKITG
jgi:hypothetical protein